MSTFITIREFLENGGVLKKGRDIFLEKKGLFLLAGILDENNIQVFKNLTFPIEPEIHYVNIKVIPIYA